MTTDTMDLAARLDAIEAPRREAARQEELNRLQAEAAKAQTKLPELVRAIEVMRAERTEAERELAAAESVLAEQRAAVARLGMREYPLERAIAACWSAIHEAEVAGRPAPVVVPPKRWAGEAFQAALHRIFGLSLMPRRKAPRAKAGPALRPGEVEGVRVRFTAPTTAGGVSRAVGDEVVVSVTDAEILATNDKVTVLERGLAVPPPRPFAVRNVSSVAVSVDGATVRPGEVVMVAGETWAGVLSGAYPSLGPADDGVQRTLDLERRAAELGIE